MRKLANKYKYNTKLLSVDSVNSSLAKVKIRVMYTGKNRNYSYFDKEVVVNKMLPTIYNTPIVGYMQDSEFTDHGDQLIIHGNGEMEYKTITYAFGMIPESTEITWENYVEDDGMTEHEYLCVTGYIWKRFEDECKKILQDGTKHSMEINVKSGFWDDSIDSFRVEDAEFAGFCAIGVEPCFEGSKIGGVNSFKLNDLAIDFSLLKEEINKLAKNNGMEVFSLENEIKNEVIESIEITEEFEEIQDETLDTETVEEFEEETEITETENIEIDNVEEEVVEEEKEEEFTEEVEDVEESVDYEKLYKDLLVEYDSLKEQNKELTNSLNDYEKAEKEIIFEAFSDRLTSDEMQSIADRVDDLSKDEIELQLFALVGKKADDNKLNFNKNQKHKIGIFDDVDTDMSAGLKAVISRKKK